jgi:hypothetical protein
MMVNLLLSVVIIELYETYKTERWFVFCNYQKCGESLREF